VNPKDFLADYDLLNFLSVFSFDFPGDDLKKQFQDAQENLNEWQA
jgi:hypothetical protein